MLSFHQVAAIAIFSLTYLLLSGWNLKFLPLTRPAAALLGAVLMVAFGVVTPQAAYQSVNGDTLVLLLGMMLIGAYLFLSGFFSWVAHWILNRAGIPQDLLLYVILASGMLSALLVNDAVCLMLTPLVVEVIHQGKLPLAPYLLALAMSANVGSVATLVGNPQNMIIGLDSGISFFHFSESLFPVSAIGLIMVYVILSVGFRKQLNQVVIVRSKIQPSPIDRPLMAITLIILASVFVGFLLGLNLAWTALAGGVALLVLGRRDTHEALELVDWYLLVFFAGLFVVVGAFSTAGLTDLAYEHIHAIGESSPAMEAWNLSWLSIIGSNLFSNVPFVLIAAKWMNHFAHPELMWKVLAMATTFAGNLTILGSVANVIVIETARRHVQISFWDYIKYGIPITILTTLMGTGILWWIN